jgi:ATP-dependent exoDNAse (exonuclease V) beta subunit
VADVQGAEGVTVVEATAGLNDEQLAAVEADGSVFVSAGAGTGKTSVLVERYVRAVCERGVDVESILVITYTRKAAGELRGRIRTALRERGRPDLARELDGAWISTIHGFCNRLLRAHPFAAGLDPRFRELEDAGAAVLRGEAFDRALHEFCAGGDPERVRLLATYRADGLRRMLTGVYETLRSAGRELVLELGERPSLENAVAALRAEAATLSADASATTLQRGSAGEVLRVASEGSPPERLVDLSPFAAKGARAASYEQARKAAERAALEELASHDRVLLQELLERFGAEYAAAKRRESVVDFEDLQLAARDLLRDDVHVREETQLRFRMVMVDEFQDTNRLQCELIDLVAHPELTEVFTVGDEFQSIYGFRHADLEVFRERRAEAQTLLALTRNYRSRPQVLAAINHLFGDAFGDEYQPLAASAEFPDPVFGHPVELLVTDKASFAGTSEHWRLGEARRIARRVRELVDSGEAEPGEIVVLFAAGTDAERYEEALRREGLPTYRATGRGYFGQQQVVDLLAFLRLLHNRYDDVALATVLASPFVGVSNDALVLLRRNAPRRPLFTALERSLPEGLAPSDERLLRAFLQRYERLVRASTRIGLEELCERIVTEHDYDLAVLARWDGSRRFANLRKLGRLAREYESIRGADIAGFVKFVREQDALGAKELEAVAEEEGGGAVRLLTIHAAKGLEFKVVIVADAGRDVGGPKGPDEIVALSDGRFGFRMVHPTRGDRQPVFGFEEVRDAERDQERAERLRLYYVAMTRAIDRLVVSGAIDPSRTADWTTPIGWVLDRLDAHDAIADADDAPMDLERGDARFVLTVGRFEPAPVALLEDGRATELQLELFDELPVGRPRLGIELPSLAEIPEPPIHDVRRLSYSALALFERCSYRYFAERVLRLPPRRNGSNAVGDGLSLAPTELGDAVHRLLELVPLGDPSPPARVELDALVRQWYAGVSDDELDRIAELVDAYCASELARRVAGLAGAEPERPFTFEHDRVVLRGRLDVLWQQGGKALVVDYKSNALEGRDPREIVEAEYVLQRLVYALVCLRSGADEVEVAYQFLERPDEVVSATFTQDDAAALEAELSTAIARIRAGDFRPTPSEFACADCPALDLVCAGPRLASAR